MSTKISMVKSKSYINYLANSLISPGISVSWLPARLTSTKVAIAHKDNGNVPKLLLAKFKLDNCLNLQINKLKQKYTFIR